MHFALAINLATLTVCDPVYFQAGLVDKKKPPNPQQIHTYESPVNSSMKTLLIKTAHHSYSCIRDDTFWKGGLDPKIHAHILHAWKWGSAICCRKCLFWIKTRQRRIGSVAGENGLWKPPSNISFRHIPIKPTTKWRTLRWGVCLKQRSLMKQKIEFDMGWRRKRKGSSRDEHRKALRQAVSRTLSTFPENYLSGEKYN